jgi:hypothetical protein
VSDERAAPMYCPYCGDEDLRPHEDTPNALAEADSDRLPRRGAWECRSCTRVFSVKFVGLLARHAAAGAGASVGAGAAVGAGTASGAAASGVGAAR